MELQEQTLVQYLIFLKETEEDQELRDEKILKAVNDYYISKGL